MLSTFKQVIIEKKRFENCLLLPNTEICMPYMGSEKHVVKIFSNFELIIT